MIAVLLALTGWAEPSEQTLIYYNARMALREGRPTEAIKLWLLRNAVENATGRVSPHDEDFGSVTWAALGQLGICQDGHPTDEDGAGLWPIAMHNWVIRNMGRRVKPRKPRTFDAFSLERQQRSVSIGEVLSAQELQTLQLLQGGCLRVRGALVAAGELPNAELTDRAVTGRLLRYLLNQTRQTLATDLVRGRAVVEARLFDINLQLTALAARAARQQDREITRIARQIGLSVGSIEAIKDDTSDYTFPPDSEPARILEASVDWSVAEWMSLSADRRLFLFGHAQRYGGDPEKLDAIALGIIDALIEEGEGRQVEKWLGQRSMMAPADQTVIWRGARGERLMALDPDAGFGERSVIALHRGVHHLERGELPEAMRAIAYAMQHAPESRMSETVQNLSRRWLSYVAGQFEVTDELLISLQELIPRQDYGLILEDLMWRAAFHADTTSFERGLRNQVGRGALNRRIALLRPLASGSIRQFSRAIEDGLEDSPGETLRFLDQLVQRLEREDADIRTNHLPTLARIRALLVPLSLEEGSSGRQARTATDLLVRCQAIAEGLGALEGATAREQARALSPSGEVFVGSVRLAPTDPLPWPFRISAPSAPSIFSPIQLTPEEWTDEDGELVLGWSIEG